MGRPRWRAHLVVPTTLGGAAGEGLFSWVEVMMADSMVATGVRVGTSDIHNTTSVLVGESTNENVV